MLVVVRVGVVGELQGFRRRVHEPVVKDVLEGRERVSARARLRVHPTWHAPFVELIADPRPGIGVDVVPNGQTGKWANGQMGKPQNRNQLLHRI